MRGLEPWQRTRTKHKRKWPVKRHPGEIKRGREKAFKAGERD